MRRPQERESKFMQNILCLTEHMIEPTHLRPNAAATLRNSIAGTGRQFMCRRRSSSSLLGQIEAEFLARALRARP